MDNPALDQDEDSRSLENGIDPSKTPTQDLVTKSTDICSKLNRPIETGLSLKTYNVNETSTRQIEDLQFPDDKIKTIFSFGFMGVMILLNLISMSLTHDRVPDRDEVPPLPDIFLDSVPAHPELLHFPDILVMISIMLMGAGLLFHKHRWIVSRRLYFIIGILFLMRSITMYVTVLPVSNYSVYCSPKMNSTTIPVVTQRVWELIVGGGMQISGMKKACGDYIFSGHAIFFVSVMLIYQEYVTGERLWLLRWLTWALGWTGMGLLLLSHGHYTIDILIAYFATTRLFWTYHTLANNPVLKLKSSANPYRQVWWFRIFKYFEANIPGPLPNECNLPVPRFILQCLPLKKYPALEKIVNSN